MLRFRRITNVKIQNVYNKFRLINSFNKYVNFYVKYNNKKIFFKAE